MPVDSHQTLSAYLEQFPQSLQSTNGSFEALSGGFSGAEVFRFESLAGPRVLRVWPAKNRLPIARISGLHRLLQHIYQKGVTSVAVPERNHFGGTITEIRRRVVHVEPFMEGVADFHTSPTVERLANTMRALAEWHRAATSFQPTELEGAWFYCKTGPSPAVCERLKLLKSFLEGKAAFIRQRLQSSTSQNLDPDFRKAAIDILSRFQVLGAIVADKLRQARQWQVPLQPCLRDIWHDHVLFTGEEVTGLIDPTACRTESVASDLSRLLGSMVGNDQQAWALAITVYDQHRRLSEVEQRLIPILDHSGVLLSGMRWLEKLALEESISISPAVVKRVEQIAERLKGTQV